MKVVVLGASGFVGTAIVEALRSRGHVVQVMSAPRVTSLETSRWNKDPDSRAVLELIDRFRDSAAVINAAGIASSGGRDEDELYMANAVLPGLLAYAAAQAQVRFVHVSSAAALGSVEILDDRESGRPFSPYSRSKAEGERRVLAAGRPPYVIYRPPGVHASGRGVTRSLVRVARSRLATVASPGTDNAPQALLPNVADAIAFLAVTPRLLPRVVAHPSEGLTTTELLSLMGGKPPLMLPRRMTRSIVVLGNVLGRRLPLVAAASRRVDVMWHGQRQAASWLTEAGWTPPVGHEAWAGLDELPSRN